jgi:putative endonuclease
MNRRDTGAAGEKIARDYLKKKGYRILEQNFRCREGEIDIVAEHKKCLVFVEVRARTGDSFGLPVESVGPAKQHRLIAASFQYLNAHDLDDRPWRIDFIGVEMNPDGKARNIDHIESAIGD